MEAYLLTTSMWAPLLLFLSDGSVPAYYYAGASSSLYVPILSMAKLVSQVRKGRRKGLILLAWSFRWSLIACRLI